MFQISRRVDYAVRIMIELGLHEGEFMSAQRLSDRTDVPKSFLHKIALDLVKANLVYTQAGPGGGLTVSKPLDQINLLHIVEAAEGPICLNVCLIRPEECNRDRFCPGHDFWGHLQLKIMQELREVTLGKLVTEARELQSHPRSKKSRENIPYLLGNTAVSINNIPVLEEVTV